MIHRHISRTVVTACLTITLMLQQVSLGVFSKPGLVASECLPVGNIHCADAAEAKCEECERCDISSGNLCSCCSRDKWQNSISDAKEPSSCCSATSKDQSAESEFVAADSITIEVFDAESAATYLSAKERDSRKILSRCRCIQIVVS